MTSPSHKIMWMMGNFFQNDNERSFWLKIYGNQKTMMLDDWFRNFLIRTGNKEKLKILLRILQETGLLDHLWEAADHTHCAAVICTVENWFKVRKVSCTHTHTHTFVYQVDILNTLCDYQFVFFVLDELCVSHHAWCSKWTCSKSAS